MERKIGEVFQDGEVTLKVEKSDTINACNGCFYDKVPCQRKTKLRGYCTLSLRIDNETVIFTKQD